MDKKERMPLWLAVAITVVLVMPLGLWLDAYNLPLWIVFCVWAEYFAFGGSLKGARTLFPAFLLGVVAAGLVQALATALISWFGDAHLVTSGDLAILVAYFVGFCVVVWAMKFVQVVQGGSLAYFQGIALTLGAIFTGQGAAYIAHSENSYALIAGSMIIAAVSAFVGCLIGWINIWLNGVKEVQAAEETPAAHAAAAS